LRFFYAFIVADDQAIALKLKLDVHSMRPLRFLSACVWFRDVTSFSDASGMVCVRVGT